MAFDELIARINLMIIEMENQPGDAHELYEQIRLELNQLRATGQPLPEDLAKLEAELSREFETRAESRQ